MLAVQLGSSSRAARWLLGGCAVSCLVFGLIAVTLRDGVAAAFCLAALACVVRLGLMLRSRTKLEQRAGTVSYGRTCASALDDGLFVSFSHYVVGGRVRRGVLLIGPTLAAFVPVGGWTHVALQALAAPFVAQIRFVDLALELGATGDVDAVLHDAVARHDGFFIDDSWTYMVAQRWLWRPGEPGLVWIERAPPASTISRWAVAPPPSEERYQWIRDRVLAAAAVIVAVVGLAGVVAWRVSGDIDYLVAALVYGVLIGGSVVGGVVLAKRRPMADLPGA